MKILIVDDSAIFRSFMKNCLADLSTVEVVGWAADGRKALEAIDTLKPDLITLDMNMPNMSGLDVLKQLQNKQPNIKVIVVSCATETDSELTVKALELGAFDFLIKPTANITNAKKHMQDILFPQIKEARSLGSMLGHKINVAKTIKKVTPVKKKGLGVKPLASIRKFRPDLIAIGSSTGGPAALSTVIKGLPHDFPVPVVITQHMPKLFIESLAERLDKDTKINCSVAKDGEKLLAGHVYIAPGDIHMKIVSKVGSLSVALDNGARVNHSKPAVDVTYDSLVMLSPGVKTLALVLTGMGNDGAKGAKTLADRGNYVMVQDEKTSVVWGMPGETFRLGAAKEVLPLDQIAHALMHHTNC
ncbi:MAG: chemotaxis-specific protein-glutamate methyltransferase CheB [Ghiorsea sp.]